MKLFVASLLPAVSHGWKSMVSPCALPTCTNTLFMRSIQSRVGINLGQTWYCSVDCFVAAARSRYSALAAGKVVDFRHVPRRSIGLLLLSLGYLNEDQLRLAITESELRGEKLEETLKQLGLANERQIAIARAAQWGYPVCGEAPAIHEVQADIPRTLLEACSAVPLHYSATAKRFVLGFVDRVEHSLLTSLETITGMRPEPCFVTRADFERQMSHFLSFPDCEEVVSDLPATPAEMARTTGRFAIEARARDVRFTRCRGFLWTRLLGKQRKVDLLFRIGSAPLVREASLLAVPSEENLLSLG